MDIGINIEDCSIRGHPRLLGMVGESRRSRKDRNAGCEFFRAAFIPSKRIEGLAKVWRLCFFLQHILFEKFFH